MSQPPEDENAPGRSTPPEAADQTATAEQKNAEQEKAPEPADGSIGSAAAIDDMPEHLSTDDIEKLLAQASGELDHAAEHPITPQAKPEPFHFDSLSEESNPQPRQPMDLLGDVELDLRVELGRTEMRLEEVLLLRSGSVVALDKLAGDPVDIFANGRLIARGEVLVMNDNFCVRVTELVGA